MFCVQAPVTFTIFDRSNWNLVCNIYAFILRSFRALALKLCTKVPRTKCCENATILFRPTLFSTILYRSNWNLYAEHLQYIFFQCVKWRILAQWPHTKVPRTIQNENTSISSNFRPPLVRQFSVDKTDTLTRHFCNIYSFTVCQNTKTKDSRQNGADKQVIWNVHNRTGGWQTFGWLWAKNRSDILI